MKKLTLNVECIRDCYEDGGETLIYKGGEIYQTHDNYFIRDETGANRQWVADGRAVDGFFQYFKLIVDHEAEARHNVYIAVLSATMRGNDKLNSMLNDFRHNLDDQMLDLKYGKGYKANFMELLAVAVGRL